MAGRAHDQTFRAQSTLSKRAPVVRNLFHQTLKGSSHAVILSANSGTNKRFNSASVLVQANAATRPPEKVFDIVYPLFGKRIKYDIPADVPVMTRGRRSASANALTTPK